jgi:hypothetical protein
VALFTERLGSLPRELALCRVIGISASRFGSFYREIGLSAERISFLPCDLDLCPEIWLSLPRDWALCREACLSPKQYLMYDIVSFCNKMTTKIF